MLDLIVLHGEFHYSQLEATFGTKFIKIRDKNSVPTHGAYYIDYNLYSAL